MTNPHFVGDEQWAYRDAIRDFCERSTSSGGILLVSGSRGSGKTRLVDEALNERNGQSRLSWLRQCFGDITASRRASVTRRPRGVERTLIRVDVDPFFPHKDKAPDADQAKNTDQTSGEADTDVLAMAFIRNIVFALTSAIDCRYSRRTHGKTLRDKLGFWQYWFDRNALLHAFSCRERPLLQLVRDGFFIAVPLMIVLWLPLYELQALVPQIVPQPKWELPLILVAYCEAAVLVAWLFLRWRDLCGLKRMSQKLYMLVNSVKASETHQQSRETKTEGVFKAPLLLLIALLAVSFFDISFATVKQWFEDETLITLAGVSAVSVTFTWLFVRKDDHLEEYGKENAVWMINLLRRYLYICHRCGLEPVLVIDELDKLEELDAWWLEKKSGDDGLDTAARPEINRLRQFLLMLSRLKASLGAEFLWILIGGPPTLTLLHQDRHRRPDGTLGILATTIQQEIVLAPFPLATANNLLEQIRPSTGGNRAVEEDRIKKTLWLRCRGNFSTMVREIERGTYFDNVQPGVARAAQAVTEAWPIEWQWAYVSALSALPSPILREKLEQPFVQAWIHAGMMNMANHILSREVTVKQLQESISIDPKQIEEMADENEPPELAIIRLGRADLLLALGGRMIYSHLQFSGLIEFTPHRRPYIEE